MSDIWKHIESVQSLSRSIPKLVAGIESVQNQGLSKRAIVVLVADAAGCGKVTAERVIDSLGKLSKIYVRPIKKKKD